MNNQVSHIIQGVINITIVAVLYLTISKVSLQPLFVANQDSGFCGTKSFSTEIDNREFPLASMGKMLFYSKCASCHQLFKDATGPALIGVLNREPWLDKNNLYSWVRNPEAFMKKNKYTQALRKKYGSMMVAFREIQDEELDAIFQYITAAEKFSY